MLTLEDLYRPPDARGVECDGCHDECPALWEDPDEPGEWLYCGACIRQGLAADRSGKPLSTRAQRVAAMYADLDVDQFLDDLAVAVNDMEDNAALKGTFWRP